MTKRFLGNIKTFGASSSYSTYFPGIVTAYLQLPNNVNTWPSSNNFTIEMYIYPQTVNTIVGLMSMWGAATGQFYIRRNASNQLEFTYNGASSGTVTVTGTSALIRSWKWNHICVIKSGTSLVLLVDGVVAVSTTITETISTTDTTPLRIGIDQNLTNPFLGFISNVRFCMTADATAGQIYPLTGFPRPMALSPVTTDCKFLTCNTEVIQNNSDSATFRASLPVTAFIGVSPTYLSTTDYTPYASSAPLSYPIFGPGTAGYTSPTAGSSNTGVGTSLFPNAASSTTGSTNLGVLTLADVAMSAAQGNLSNYDPLNSSNCQFTTALIKVAPTGTGNNTFIDSSSIGATVARSGNTHQGTYTPFYPTVGSTVWSAYINDNTYFSTTTTPPGTASCTYEWFFLLTAPLAGTYTFMNTRSGDTTDGFDVYIDATGVIKCSYTALDFFVSTTADLVQPNTWYHMAVVWNGTNVSVYLNGVALAPSPQAQTTRTFTSTVLQIGTTATQGASFRGYISNFRYLQGVAQYTTTFTPPTPPLGVVTSATVTRILTLQNYNVQDNSGNNATFINVNNSSLQMPANVTSNALLPPPDPPVIGGSAFFDGTGDYLTLTSSTNYAPGTGDFSVDCWFNTNTIPGIAADIIYNSAARWYIELSSTGTLVTFDGTTTFTIAPTNGIVTGGWYHVAITKVGTQVRCFLNGKLTATAVTSYTSTTAQTFLVGGNSASNPFTGYISNVRFVKGGIPTLFSTASTTLGTQVFTPSLSPLTGDEALTAGTVNLLLKMDNYTVFDAMRRNSFESLANFTTSNAVTKFGNASMFFDGTTTGYLQGNSSGFFGPFSATFCIDLWFYPTSLAAVSWLLDIGGTAGAARLALKVNTNGTVQIVTGSATPPATNVQTTSINPLVVGQWYHIAVVRFFNFMAIYINGVACILPASNTTLFAARMNTTSIAIGGLVSATKTGGACTGYMQDVRVTVGSSRFSNAINLGEGFNVPTGPAAVQ